MENGQFSSNIGQWFRERWFVILSVLTLIIGIYSYTSGIRYQVETHIALSDQYQKTINNDLHTLTETLKDQRGELNSLTKELIRLNTIIEERIPKK